MIDQITHAHFDSLCELLCSMNDASSAARACAELDGLVLAGDDSLELASQVLLNPETDESVSAATLLVLETRATDHFPAVLNLLRQNDGEFKHGVRLGLRLARIDPIFRELQELARDKNLETRIAVLDVLSFHRVSCSNRVEDILKIDDPTWRAVFLEACGRTGEHQALMAFARDTDPEVKRLFWKAMARAGHPDTLSLCRRRCIQSQPCHDAIRFLGVIAGHEDLSLLRRLTADEATACPAVEAMGILGATEIIPDLLSALRSPVTGIAAAVALERVTGRMVPRKDPPPPPDHLTEDELDFWFHPGDPILEAADEWWRKNHYYFEPGKRYQAGICVSDDPLGPHFDSLPTEVRESVYLRQRALHNASTPDWELETWPQHQRTPNWATVGGFKK